MATAAVELSKQRTKVERFYRPELDVLRFIAFLAVFVCHGPRLLVGASAPAWKIRIVHVFEAYAHSGAWGVCLFFLLSSYLITELLLQERHKTDTVHLKAFYIRRILRIWPLYFAGVAIAIAVGLHNSTYRLSRSEILYLLCFVGWMGKAYHFNPMGPLWSISCEEIFYIVWPTVVKMRGKASILVASFTIIPISLISAVVVQDNWYNPVTQFLFFAFGALLALWLHRRNFSMPNATRIPIILFAFGCWGYLMSGQLPLPKPLAVVTTQTLIALTCTLLFLALYGCPSSYLPRPLVYLGRISYGLYVFHALCYLFVERFLLHRLPGTDSQLISLLFNYFLTLAATIALAAASFHFFEQPFLTLKRRFTFVRSRD